MSELMIKREIRKLLRTSSLEINSKMVCPIVKLFNMKYGQVDNDHVASIAIKLINISIINMINFLKLTLFYYYTHNIHIICLTIYILCIILINIYIDKINFFE